MSSPWDLIGPKIPIKHEITYYEKVPVLEYNIRTILIYLDKEEKKQVLDFMKKLAGKRMDIIDLATEKDADNNSDDDECEACKDPSTFTFE